MVHQTLSIIWFGYGWIHLPRRMLSSIHIICLWTVSNLNCVSPFIWYGSHLRLSVPFSQQCAEIGLKTCFVQEAFVEQKYGAIVKNQWNKSVSLWFSFCFSFLIIDILSVYDIDINGLHDHAITLIGVCVFMCAISIYLAWGHSGIRMIQVRDFMRMYPAVITVTQFFIVLINENSLTELCICHNCLDY